MPRQPNTRPTTIYWLVDIRPETIAKGWSNGYPFYCGKTIFDPATRFAQHRHAANRLSKRPVCAWLVACGRFVEIRTVEVVPADKDWAERERHWISHLREHYPVCSNVCDGGQGLPGYVPEPRARKEPILTVGAIIKREMKKFDDARTRGVNARRLDKMPLADIRQANIQARACRKTRIEKMRGN